MAVRFLKEVGRVLDGLNYKTLISSTSVMQTGQRMQRENNILCEKFSSPITSFLSSLFSSLFPKIVN